MKLEALHIGMNVRHPQYGLGTVKTISELTAEIRFTDSVRVIEPVVSGLVPAEAQASLTGLEIPLARLIDQTVAATIAVLDLALPDDLSTPLAVRWHNGRLVLHPADPTLQTKEVPIEVFFHKIVMMRNNLRVLEQKINGHEKLSDAEKVEMQQYISRCYGTMTTFNILFKDKDDQFASKGE